MMGLIDGILALPWAAYAIDVSARLAIAALVFIGGWYLSRALLKLFVRVLTRTNVDPMLRDFLRNLASGALLVVVVVASLDQLGVPMTSIMAALGAAGLAVALALRDSLSNLAAGVMLILLKPFRAGDTITVGGPGAQQTGRVESLRLMHTVLVTADNSELVLPNNHVANQPILNASARATRRVDLLLSIALREDVPRAFGVLLDTLKGDPRVLSDPAPQITVERLTDTAVEIALRPWADTGNYWALRSDLLQRIQAALAEAA
jgi:small conductance mechanosensitive channel